MCIHYFMKHWFEWDPIKAETNRKDHEGVSFADALNVFEDPGLLTEEDEREEGEERYAAIGVDSLGRILVVIYTWRGDTTIRIISARKATRHETRQYEESQS